MSAKSSTVSAEHFRYIAEHTPADDVFLTELKQAAEAAGLPRIWISPEQASFLQIILKLAAAKRVVEVGTLAGYSAIAMARALPAEGHVDTIELEPRYADFAEQWVSNSNVAGRVTVHRGVGADVLPGFKDLSADALFMDADKSGYPTYLKEALRIVRPGGLIMADNAFAFGQLFDQEPTDPEVPAVRQFNDLLAATEGLHGIIVPIGDGCWVAVRE